MKIAISALAAVALLGLAAFLFWSRQPGGETGQPIPPLPPATGSQPILPPSAGEAPGTAQNFMHTVIIKTNLGEIRVQTYDADAPKTVRNFIALAEKGFYNNLTFHRVVKNFVIQGGDPNCNSLTPAGPCGAGGPGYAFEDELNPATESYKAGYKKGVVAMANAGPNTNGSQFFIMLADTPLPHSYSIFGKVVSGQEVVDAIGTVRTGANDRPLQPVIMTEVRVESAK